MKKINYPFKEKNVPWKNYNTIIPLSKLNQDHLMITWVEDHSCFIYNTDQRRFKEYFFGAIMENGFTSTSRHG